MNSSLIKMLEKERDQLTIKLRLLEDAITTYRNSEVISPGQMLFKGSVINVNDFQERIRVLFKKYQEYDAALPTRSKILFIIKAENRFLHVREIARIVQQLEDEVSLAAVIKKISPALSILKRIPGSPLVSIEVDHSHFNTFWGYNNWLNEDGSIKAGFTYNECEITKFQRESIFNIAI